MLITPINERDQENIKSGDHTQADRSSSVLVRITHPNSCSLKYDKSGLQLRKMLEMSGIELKECDQSTEWCPE